MNTQISATSLVHAETEHDGSTFTADYDPQTGVVSIARDGVWSGDGKWDDAGDSIVDCAAELVAGNSDATDDVYSALEQELAEKLSEVAS